MLLSVSSHFDLEGLAHFCLFARVGLRIPASRGLGMTPSPILAGFFVHDDLWVLIDAHPNIAQGPARKRKRSTERKQKRRSCGNPSGQGSRVLPCSKPGRVPPSIRLASCRFRFRYKVDLLNNNKWPDLAHKAFRSAALTPGIQTLWFYPGPWPSETETQTETPSCHCGHSLYGRTERIHLRRP